MNFGFWRKIKKKNKYLTWPKTGLNNLLAPEKVIHCALSPLLSTLGQWSILVLFSSTIWHLKSSLKFKIQFRWNLQIECLILFNISMELHFWFSIQFSVRLSRKGSSCWWMELRAVPKTRWNSLENESYWKSLPVEFTIAENFENKIWKNLILRKRYWKFREQKKNRSPWKTETLSQNQTFTILVLHNATDTIFYHLER